ncbi:MAG TPA: class I SAM-dependent methyltransferase [Streptosporangiaceae bacterium]
MGTPDPNAVYSLGSSPGESERLLRQAQDLAGDSAALLGRPGLRPGHHAIDLGCGPRGILELLAARVAPGGRVTGVDANQVHVAMATAFAASRGLAGVEVIEAGARQTGLPSGSFDLIHARTLLVTIPQAADVVTRWPGWPDPAAGSWPWSPTSRPRCATRRWPPLTG